MIDDEPRSSARQGPMHARWNLMRGIGILRSSGMDPSQVLAELNRLFEEYYDRYFPEELER